ncbi:MAG: HPr family phosphocarrier protein, partial [Deltaproteobacteria bacterium]
MTIVEREIVITNSQGLHARPAAVLVEALKSYEARVHIEVGSKRADARSIRSVLALGGSTGDVARVTAEGDDASEVVARIEAIL